VAALRFELCCLSLSELYRFRNSSGSLAIFAAIRRASSFVSCFAADRRPGFSQSFCLSASSTQFCFGG
jgi:hypothetical protein